MKKKKSRIGVCLFMCIAMMLSIMSFHTEAYADDKNEVTLNFNGTPTFQNGEVIYTIDDTHYKIGLRTKTVYDSYEKVNLPDSNDLTIDLNSDNYYLYVRAYTDSIESGFGNVNARLYINEKTFDVSSTPYIYLDPAEFSGILNLRLEKFSNVPPRPNYPDSISIRGTYDGLGMKIYLNSERIGSKLNNITATGKGYASGNINNLLTIQLAFGDGNIGSVTVNDQQIAIPEGTTDHLTFEVAPASSYNIVVKKRQAPTEVPRTIIWASDKSNNSSLKDDELLKHGTIEILDVQDSDGNSLGLENVKQDTIKNNGWAIIIPGSKIIFRMTPDYGYQLTTIMINDKKLTAREEQSTFEYIMPDTNVHISGIFEKVEDKVVTSSQDIKNGEIQISDSEITSGSVVLSVKDPELTDAEKADFAKAATGYQISSYLNIDLNQILYKGTADDVWNNSLSTLKNNATVKLQLAQNTNGSKLVVVHEKHDGTYELIPTTYDASTQTITFLANSFSNYAIASKTETEDDGKTPADSGANRKDPATSGNKGNKGQKPSATAKDSNTNKPTTVSKEQKNVNPVAVKTGDNHSAGLYAMIALFAFIILSGVFMTQKKK